MSVPSGIVVVFLLLTAGLAGCLGSDPVEPQLTDEPADAPAWTPCEHPFPCADGSEWPVDLEAPEGGFDLAQVVPIRIPMADGVELDGAVYLPDVPEGTPLPTILWATPYGGQCNAGLSCRDAPASSDAEGDLARALYELIGPAGYAFTYVNVRGTGLSDGCHDFYGARSQHDLGQAVTWLSEQDWSNGRVGMWGLSAMGTTPWMAAIEAPDALKAIAPAGIISDLYLNRFTPQGAPKAAIAHEHATWAAFNSEVPAAGALQGSTVGDWPTVLPAMAQASSQRICPDVAGRLSAGATGQYTDDRGEAFWGERRLVDRFDQITAAVLVMHGAHEGGHAFQEDAIWPTLEDTPRRMLLGAWGHQILFDEFLEGHPTHNETMPLVIEWFDFWLKGIGDPPRLGVVDYQLHGAIGTELGSSGAWVETDAWPPREAREEVIYLAGEALAPEPASDARTFRALTTAAPTPCGTTLAPSLEPDQISYVTPELEEAITIAGNPMASLTVTVDQPGGVFALDLYELGERDGACLAHQVAHGAIDLRFHAGNPQGEDFPTGEPTPVRVDLWSTAYQIEAGHRLQLVLSGQGEFERRGQPFQPLVELGPDSHLVLPLVEGSLGGQAPMTAYPPRPLVPPN